MHSTGSRANGDYLEVQIDETGDRGTKPSSSPYFFMAACAFLASRRNYIETAMRDLNRALGRPLEQEIHSLRHLRSHEKLIEASERLTKIGHVRVFFVIIPKAEITKGYSISIDTTTMYNFTCQLMLARISQFAHSVGLPVHPTFASVQGIPRENLDDLISVLQAQETLIDWNKLRLPVSVLPAKERIGIQWADIAGRALWRALIPSTKPPHRIEPIYLMTLAPAIWGERPLESHGMYCIKPRWHEEVPWWHELDALVPENNLLG